MNKHNNAVNDQIRYYQERASEYDEWFLRQGRYDRGEAHSQQWLSEIATVQRALDAFRPTGKVLELASGTGWWTEQLVKFADSITAVDSAAETIAINQAKLKSDKISYVQANIFEWEPDAFYDVVFFSFWLSHVPPEHFEPFWALVKKSLKENGRVFLVDSLYTPTSTAKDQFLKTAQDTTVKRQLNNGETFEIVKLFYSPKRLTAALDPLGWECHFKASNQFFIYGAANKNASV